MATPPPGPLEQGDLIQDLARRLVEVTPEDWRQLTYLARVIGAHRSDMLAVQEADGQVRQLEVPDGVADIVDALKHACFQQGRGTWLSMIVSVHHSLRLNVEYNHDTKPETPWELSPLAYAQELERFPRDRELVPDWLADELDQAGRLRPDELVEEFGRALVRACDREGLRAEYLPPTGLRVSDPDGTDILDSDLEETFDQAVISSPEQRADLAAHFAGFVARAARERATAAQGNTTDTGDTVATALVEAFAEAGVRASFQDANTLSVVLPDGHEADTDIGRFRSALSGATPEQIAHNATEFARAAVRQLQQAVRPDGDRTGGLRVRLYPVSAFPEGVLDSLVAREIAPGLWQTLVVDSPDSLQPLPRSTHERSGRPDAEVFEEAVAASVNETVEVSEHEIDGVRLVHVGGRHPYVAAHAHALERYLGEAPHGALVVFPVPEVLIAHPLGQGHPIVAMDNMRQIAERFVADGDKPISAQLYWWHPRSRSLAQGTPPELRPVGADIDHETRSVSLTTSDQDFEAVLASLNR